MNLPVMKAKINVGITGLTLIFFIFLGLLAYNAYLTSKQVTQSTVHFAELIKNNEFALASEIFDDVDMNTSKLWRERALTNMRSVLENRVVELTEQVLASETGFTLVERAKGLKLFQPQLGDKITSELERLVALYSAKEITYQTLVRYYQDIEASGLTTVASEKYAALIQAEELQRDDSWHISKGALISTDGPKNFQGGGMYIPVEPHTLFNSTEGYISSAIF